MNELNPILDSEYLLIIRYSDEGFKNYVQDFESVRLSKEQKNVQFKGCYAFIYDEEFLPYYDNWLSYHNKEEERIDRSQEKENFGLIKWNSPCWYKKNEFSNFQKGTIKEFFENLKLLAENNWGIDGYTMQIVINADDVERLATC